MVINWNVSITGSRIAHCDKMPAPISLDFIYEHSNIFEATLISALSKSIFSLVFYGGEGSIA